MRLPLFQVIYDTLCNLSLYARIFPFAEEVVHSIFVGRCVGYHSDTRSSPGSVSLAAKLNKDWKAVWLFHQGRTRRSHMGYGLGLTQ
jgi:hypothetical protein